jgi:RNA-binding protein
MTGKERAQLRAQANGLEPLFQIGKGGISEALIAQTADALRKRELIKLKVLLESAPESPREFADKLAEATDSEVIQVIGGSIVFYKENPDKDAPAKKKPAKNRSKNRSKHSRRPSETVMLRLIPFRFPPTSTKKVPASKRS